MQLTSGTKNWANVEVRGVSGRGRLAPRLVFTLEVSSPSESIETELRHMHIQVEYGGEVVGEGNLIGQPVYWHTGSCQLEIPTDRRLLQHVTDGMGAGDSVSLTLRWQGILRVLWKPTVPPSTGPIAGEPKAGEWTDLRVANGQMVDLSYTIARSDWFSKVLQPIGDDQYVYLEVAVPKGAQPDGWRNALVLLGDARKAYALGDDAGVFLKVRGIIEALPGSPKAIFDALPEPKRTQVDEVVKAIGKYFHSGRHVAKEGDLEGAFPVDRLDAGFALALAEVVLSYSSRALAAAKSGS